MNEIIFLVLSYLLASIPFGLIVGKLWGSVDVRQVGSGNIGTSNVMRSVGKGAAVVVLLCDVLKGAIPVWFAHTMDASPWLVGATAVIVVIGHVYSVFLRFNGGKGIATGLGAIIALDLWVAVSLIVVWVAVLFIFRYISLASILAVLWLPVALWLSTDHVSIIVAGVVLSMLTLWRHRDNLRRLRRGTEYRFGERAQEVGRR